MLLTIEDLQALPGFNNLASFPILWLNKLVGAADAAVKDWCKRDLELGFYTEYHSGKGNIRSIIGTQFPIYWQQTTIAAGSDGATLPQQTINVASTAGFHPGNAGLSIGAGQMAVPPNPGFTVQTGLQTMTYVTYTGTTATSFTGCSGGSGTLSQAAAKNRVFTPSVWFDMNGYGGQAPVGTGSGPFADGTLMTLGTQYMLETDTGANKNRSERGSFMRLSGAGAAWLGFFPWTERPGKLGAFQQAAWPVGDRNVKTAFAAGYPVYSREFRALNNAAVMLAAQIIRIQPSGQNLASESLGAYTYNVLENFDSPEMGEVRRTLATYREPAFGYD